MKRTAAGILAVALVLSVAPTVTAQGGVLQGSRSGASAQAPADASAKPEVTGTWDLLVGVNRDRHFPLELTIKQEGTGLTGMVNGDIPATVTMTEGQLKVEVDSDSVKLSLIGRLTADGLAGKATYGTMTDLDWTGTRAK